MKRCVYSALSLVTLLSFGCGSDAEEPGEIDLAGVFSDGFQTHTITETTWTQGEGADASVVDLLSVDNDLGVALGQNASDHPFNPGAYSRFDWSFDDGVIHYCQTAYDAETLDEAAMATADSTNLATGCAGFPWSTLSTPEGPSIAATYMDGFGGMHEVNDASWTIGGMGDASAFIFVEINNAAQYAIAKNAPDNAYSPGLFSRFDWVMVSGTLYYCQSAFDAATSSEAAMASADPTDPASGGCGGFAWSTLTAQ